MRSRRLIALTAAIPAGGLTLWLAAGLAGGLIFGLFSREVRAGDARDPAVTEPGPVVDIVLAGGDDASDTALMTTLRRSLEHLGATVSAHRVVAMNPHDVAQAPKLRAIAVSVWIDLGSPRAATVYVTDGRSVFVRRFGLKRELDSVALDLLDVVVTSSVDTVLSGRPIGVPREEFARSLEDRAPEVRGSEAPSQQQRDRPPEPPVVPTTPVAPPPSAPLSPTPQEPIRFGVGLFYEVSLVASTKPIDGPGLRVEGSRGRVWLALGLHGRLPYEASSGGSTVRFTPEGFRLAGGRLVPLGSWLTLIFGCGIGADVTRVQSIATPPSATAADSFLATEVAVRPSVGIEHRGRNLTLAVAGGVDVNVVNSTYSVDTSSGTRRFWSPWRFRPVAALLVGWAF